MYADDDCPLDEWVSKIDGVAEHVLQDYQVETGQDDASPKAVIKWLIDKLEGVVIVPPTCKIKPESAYLVPAIPDSAFLDTEAVPTENALVPMILNVKTVPAAAKLLAAQTKLDIKAQVVDEVKLEEHDSEPDFDDADFEIDVTGDREEKSIVEQETRGSDIQIHDARDVDFYLQATAGLSVLPQIECPVVNTVKYASFSDIYCRLDDKLQTANVAPVIREVVAKNPTERHSLKDKIQRKTAERKRRQNELDDFFGMKRQIITPEMRQELQTINLRGFINPTQRYRGSKRQFELAEADSGFFEIGQIVGGGIHDKPLRADGSTHVTGEDSKRKKVKSLVKSLLIN